MIVEIHIKIGNCRLRLWCYYIQFYMYLYPEGQDLLYICIKDINTIKAFCISNGSRAGMNKTDKISLCMLLYC